MLDDLTSYLVATFATVQGVNVGIGADAIAVG
jgi:hypothetical protein